MLIGTLSRACSWNGLHPNLSMFFKAAVASSFADACCFALCLGFGFAFASVFTGGGPKLGSGRAAASGATMEAGMAKCLLELRSAVGFGFGGVFSLGTSFFSFFFFFFSLVFSLAVAFSFAVALPLPLLVGGCVAPAACAAKSCITSMDSPLGPAAAVVTSLWPAGCGDGTIGVCFCCRSSCITSMHCPPGPVDAPTICGASGFGFISCQSRA